MKGFVRVFAVRSVGLGADLFPDRLMSDPTILIKLTVPVPAQRCPTDRHRPCRFHLVGNQGFRSVE